MFGQRAGLPRHRAQHAAFNPLTISVRDSATLGDAFNGHCEPCRWPDATVKNLAWCTSVAEVRERTGAAVADEPLEPWKTPTHL
jgi:hypothetical protein